MKRSNIVLLLVCLATISAHGYAQEQQFVVNAASAKKRAALAKLLRKGYLVPLASPNKYAVDKYKTEEILGQDAIQSREARRTMDLLQDLVGDEVDIRSVNVIDARYASQDISTGN